MSLISKPFDDSGVDFVDEVTKYGLAIYHAVDGHRHATDSALLLSKADGKSIALAVCRFIDSVIADDTSGAYRAECVRSAGTLYLDVVGTQPQTASATASPDPIELAQEIAGIVARPGVVPKDETVTTHTVLLALVWAALMFCSENLPIPEARAIVKEAIASGSHRVH